MARVSKSSDGRGLRARAAAEAQRRVERRLGDSDLFVRGRDLPLGRGDVGPSLEQRRRKTRPATAAAEADSAAAGIDNSDGGLPVSTAIACSNWARGTAKSTNCARSGFQLRLRQRHVAHRRDAAVDIGPASAAHIARTTSRWPPAAGARRPVPESGSNRRRAPPGTAAGHSRVPPPMPARRRRLPRTLRRMLPQTSA